MQSAYGSYLNQSKNKFYFKTPIEGNKAFPLAYLSNFAQKYDKVNIALHTYQMLLAYLSYFAQNATSNVQINVSEFPDSIFKQNSISMQSYKSLVEFLISLQDLPHF